MDDVRAVMDAAGSRWRPFCKGASEGGAMSVLFAATYPERTRGLYPVRRLSVIFLSRTRWRVDRSSWLP